MSKFKTKFFPKPEDIDDYVGLANDNLPKKAIPFIWYFAKILIKPYGLITIVYATAIIAMALEPLFFGALVDALIMEDDELRNQYVFYICIGYILLCQFYSRSMWQLGHFTECHVRPLIRAVVQKKLATYLSGHSTRYFQDEMAGRLSGKILEMPEDVSQTLDDLTNPILFTGITVLMVFGILAYISIILGVIAFLFFGLLLLAIYLSLTAINTAGNYRAQKVQGMRGVYVDSVSNILVTKLFSRRNFESKFLSGVMTDTTKAYQEEEFKYWRLKQKQHILSGLFQIVLLSYTAYAYLQGELTIGQVATVLALGLSFVSNIWWFLQTMAGFFSRFATIEEALGTLMVDQEVLDVPSAPKLFISSAEIFANNINFSYGEKMVFKNFDLKIPAGQKLGLIGPSGAGKSSLMQLLLRLYDIQEGEILIDGQNIADVQQDSLRENIAVIPQSTDLLHRSLRENIAYGKLDATEDEIIKAAKQAHAHDFILNMEDKDGHTGYDAMVGERGVKLSGGQRQRIAIARAILKDAPILILDEATSALDSESEKLIQESLQDLMKGKTVIAIAHRLSTIAHLDRLIVLNEGHIIEDGTHDELLKKQDGLYAKLWSMQSGGFLNKDAA